MATEDETICDTREEEQLTSKIGGLQIGSMTLLQRAFDSL